MLAPDYFEVIRRKSLSVSRVNNVDVLTTQSNDTYAYCHIPYFFPFSFFPDENGPRQPFPVQGPFEGVAAIHLAMMHLNTGDGRVVSEVEGLNETCNIRFTFEVHDTEMWETTAVNRVIEILDRESTQSVESLPCAFLGAGRSAVTMPMSIITGISKYPQMSGISTSNQLDDRSQYRYFSRLIPSDDGTAIPVMLYFRDIIKTEHVAVIHTNNPYSNSFLGSLQKAGTEYAPSILIQSIDIPFNLVTDQDLETAVAFLKSTQYRYIFAIIDGPKIYGRLLTEAHKQGIAGDDHVWIYSDSLFPSTITDNEYEPDSPLAVAGRGSSMFIVQPGLPGTKAFDDFVSSFGGLNKPVQKEFLQSKHPVYEEEQNYEPLQVADIFGAPDPGPNAIFLYDATIAMGLAACSVADPISFFNGPTHYEAIINTTFEGVSGTIQIDPDTGSRDPSSAFFQLINFVERRNPASGKVFFETVKTDIFKNSSWESLAPYVYGDGTSNIPSSLPPVEVDYNYIGNGLRATGFVAAAAVIMLSTIFAWWTIRFRKSKVVCASQPIFLLFICAGVLLMGSAIIPLSIDDKIASKQGCDIACMSTPWLFVLGFAVTFSALFSKTWRINKVFHNPSMKRIKVTPVGVMKPLIALLLVNVAILSLWSALSPLKWERRVSSVDVFGQTVETVGVCYPGSWEPYVIVLSVINIGALVVAAYQAYRARDIALEFAESKFIGRAILLYLLSCLYGIPILVITWEDPSARYFVLMAIFFVCSMSVLLLIFVPKVRYHRRGGFRKASVVVRDHIQSIRPAETSNVSGSYVSGLLRDSIATDATDDTEEGGVRVLDNPIDRAALLERNHELLETQKRLQVRLETLESGRRLSSSRAEETMGLVDETIAITEEEKTQEEEAIIPTDQGLFNAEHELQESDTLDLSSAEVAAGEQTNEAS